MITCSAGVSSSVQASTSRRAIGKGGEALDFGYDSYQSLTWPKVSVRVGIGYVNDDGFYNYVGLWAAIPESDPRRHYWDWLFSNAEELEAVMRRIRDEVVDVFALPLWDRPGAIKELVDRYEEEQRLKALAEAAERTKQEAHAAFQEGDYAKTVALYERLTLAELEPSHRKRLEIARKKLAGREGSEGLERCPRRSSHSSVQIDPWRH